MFGNCENLQGPQLEARPLKAEFKCSHFRSKSKDVETSEGSCGDCIGKITEESV